MPTDVKFDDRDYTRVVRRLNELIQDGLDLAPAMRAISEFFLSRVQDSFAREQAPDGTPWAPLAPGTLRERRRRGKDGPILQRDRQLLGSMDTSYGPTSAAAGTNVVYAATHQFGAELPPRQQVLAFAARGGRFTSRRAASRRRAGAVRVAFASTGAVTIPARPFLGFERSDVERVLDIIEDHLAGSGGA